MSKFLKIMIALALSFSMVMALASCDMLPDELRETIDGLLGNEVEEEIEEEEEEEEEEACKHVPGDWFEDSKATCQKAGLRKLYCKLCWELLEEEVVPQLDYHDYDNGVCKVCKHVQTESVGLTYGKDANGDTVVTGIGTCTDSSLYIAAIAPDGTPVVGIAKGAFRNVTAIVSLIIERGLEYIDEEAFSGATKLQRINIPVSTDTVGANAFNLCPIRVATIPAKHGLSIRNTSLVNVTLIGNAPVPANAFQGCENLSTVKLEEGITSIGQSAFASTAVTNVTIPDSVTRIGQSAFEFCKSLKVLTIGKNVKTIEDLAFQNASYLDTVYIPASVEYIGFKAFYRCPRITKVTFEDPNGWLATTSATAITGQQMPADMLSDIALAAEYIKSNDMSYFKKM